MGYIALSALGLVVLLVAIAFVNTLRIKLPDPSDLPGPLCVTDEAARLHGEHLARMIRIPTISRREDGDLKEFRALHRCLEELFPLVHANLERVELSGNLLYHWKGTDSGRLPILLMAHQDIVPAPPEGWSHPPFDGVIEDGRLYGRGTLDSKCNVYSQFAAVEELLKAGFTPPFDVYVEMSINEETGGEGAAMVARYLRDKGVRVSLVMDEGGTILDVPMKGMDRPYAVLGIVEKGYMDVRVTASGTGGHSSTPPRNTPLARLAAFIHEVETTHPFKKVLMKEVAEMFSQFAGSFPFGLRFLLGNLWLFKPLVLALLPRVSPFGEALIATTCAFTMCGGSDAPNVIPSKAYVVANLRTSVHQNCDASLAVLKKIADKHALSLEVMMRRDASPRTDIRGKEYLEVEGHIRTCFPGIGVAPYFIMGGTDARHFHMVSDNVLRFTPVSMTTEQMETCHGLNENVNLASLAEAVEFYKYFIRGWTI